MNREDRRLAEKLAKRPPPRVPKYKPQAWWSVDAHSTFLLQAIPHEVLENFRTGKVQDGDFDTLAMRVNWCKVVCLKFAPQYLATADAGIVSMLSVKERHERLGKWGMTGPEMLAVGDSLNTLDDLQTQVRRVDLASTMREVFRLGAIEGLRAWQINTN